MIADDGKVVKIRMRSNEVGTDTCHWLPPFCHRHPACFFCFFALHTQKEGFFLIVILCGDGEEKKNLFLCRRTTCKQWRAHACVFIVCV